MKRTLAVVLAAIFIILTPACSLYVPNVPATDAPAAAATAAPTAEIEMPEKAQSAAVQQDVITERPLEPIQLVDLIGREMTVTPGSYERVVCIGPDALRFFCYVGEAEWLCGVEDADNGMSAVFSGAQRPYALANSAALSALPSCGSGGSDASAIDAERIRACNPDVVLSTIPDAQAAQQLSEQLGVPVVTLRTGGGVFDAAFRQSIRLVGVVLGRTGLAAALIRFVEVQQKEIGDALQSVDGPASESDYGTNYELALLNAWYAAKAADPNRFADVDFVEKANAVTTAFYGEALYETLNLNEIYRS